MKPTAELIADVETAAHELTGATGDAAKLHADRVAELRVRAARADLSAALQAMHARIEELEGAFGSDGLERAAKALCDEMRNDPSATDEDGDPLFDEWERLHAAGKQAWRKQAKAVLNAARGAA